MASKFLSAEWKNLLMLNYEVDAAILKPYLPAFTEIDQFNGKCFVSMVGFLFLNTKVMGISFPFHKNFEEINLRFYVRYKDRDVWKRGVVFIKEIVPKFMITTIANTLYNENYATHQTKNTLHISNEKIELSYQWKTLGEWNFLKATAKNELQTICQNSEEEFITEHYWGYAKYNNKKTVEYQVEHPKWEIYTLISHEIYCNFNHLYGAAFAHLASVEPSSILLAKGSAIKVRKPNFIV